MRWFKKKQHQTRREPHLMASQNDYVFRRSRTLTGSVSNHVATPAASNGQLKTDRLKLHELQAQRTKALRILAVVVGVMAVLGFFVVNFIVSPKFVVIPPQAPSPDFKSYQETVYAYFADHPLERFGFLLDFTRLEDHMIRRHTEILHVSLNRAWYGGNARISLQFRQPLLAWKTGDRQFYVDTHGVAFTYNGFAAPAVTVTDQSGLPPDQTGMVASTRFVKFLGQMVGAVNGYDKGRVVEVIIPSSTRQIDIKLEGRGYTIKTNSDRDPLTQAEDIVNTINYMDEKKLKPHYIDVRVAHKAYFK